MKIYRNVDLWTPITESKTTFDRTAYSKDRFKRETIKKQTNMKPDAQAFCAWWLDCGGTLSAWERLYSSFSMFSAALATSRVGWLDSTVKRSLWLW